jgi:hypothetical protein
MARLFISSYILVDVWRTCSYFSMKLKAVKSRIKVPGKHTDLINPTVTSLNNPYGKLKYSILEY